MCLLLRVDFEGIIKMNGFIKFRYSPVKEQSGHNHDYCNCIKSYIFSVLRVLNVSVCVMGGLLVSVYT